MNDIEELSKKMILVKMDEIEISTSDKSVIGTTSLGPCIGFILYNEECKRAIVGHLSNNAIININKTKERIRELIYNNNLIDKTFDLIIIEGGYQSIAKYYNEFGKMYTGIERTKYFINSINEIMLNNIYTYNSDDGYDKIETLSLEGGLMFRQFAFDASSGNFVTNKIFNNGRGNVL